MLVFGMLPDIRGDECALRNYFDVLFQRILERRTGQRVPETAPLVWFGHVRVSEDDLVTPALVAGGGQLSTNSGLKPFLGLVVSNNGFEIVRFCHVSLWMKGYTQYIRESRATDQKLFAPSKRVFTTLFRAEPNV